MENLVDACLKCVVVLKDNNKLCNDVVRLNK